MRNTNFIAITLFAAFLLAFLGCGGDSTIAPVSGIVTCDGEPLAKVKLVFSPEPIDGNFAVGPFSTGTTDSEGRFTLKTRNGVDGAFVGGHKVAFEPTGVSSGKLDGLNEQMINAKADGKREKYTEAKKKFDSIKRKLKGLPRPGTLPNVISISADGEDNLKLELDAMPKWD